MFQCFMLVECQTYYFVEFEVSGPLSRTTYVKEKARIDRFPEYVHVDKI